MAFFLVRRILLGLVVLWVITTVVFVMFFVAPRNVAQLIAGRQATPETVALVAHRLGLDQPILTQYFNYLRHLLHGDLGYSYYNSTPVTKLIAQRVPVTASLAIGAAVLWLLIGISSGVLAATRPRSLADRAVTASALFFYSMPAFLLGLILLYFLFYRLTLAGIDLFPGSGYVPFTEDPIAWAQHLVAAVAHARAGHGRDVYAAHARGDARRAGRGLHPHRALEGHERAARDLPARPAQCADPGRHTARHRSRARCSAGRSSRRTCSACPGSVRSRCNPSSSRTSPS